MPMAIHKEKSLLSAEELRQHAEERLQERAAEPHPLRTDEEMQRLVHELEVHQIELEMQNEELCQAKDMADRTLDMYTDLYDFAPVGYVTLDREGNVQRINLTGADLLGMERTRLVGSRFGFFVADEDRLVLAEFLGKVLTSLTKELCEVRLLNEGSIPIWVQLIGVTTTSGQECRLTITDITERKHAEEELREKERLLLQQSRLAAMGEIINNIAHQWRQPLNTLGLSIQSLKMFYDLGEFTKEILDHNVSYSMELIQHMSKTIDDFMHYFKSDKEKISYRIHDVVLRTVSLVEDCLKYQHISIDVHANANPTVVGFPNEYSQVLLNIIMNAKDALLGKRHDDARVTITISEEGERSVVTIADNGGGIPKDIIDKVFEPYFTTKELDQGTGIGLFMSKAIIEKSMGGKLTVQNLGDGAEFRIEV